MKRNEMEAFVMRWMELESVIQSEVSQKEKNKYSMLTHKYGIRGLKTDFEKAPQFSSPLLLLTVQVWHELVTFIHQ